MQKSSRTLEVCCYIICLGAFGIFVRWMQLMLAYNEESLVDRSFWSVAIILLLVLSAYFYIRFVKQFQDRYYYLPHDFCKAFRNDTKLHSVFRWGISGLMIAGALLLLMQCEVDKNANFLRVVACAGIVTGLAFGWLLSAANRPAVLSRRLVSFLSSIPILFMAIWIVTIYKENSINPVSWDYAVELFAAIITMIAFFRFAGFAFGVENEWRTLFFCMLGGSSCLMNLADERFVGEQVMFAALSAMQIMIVWLIIDNLKKGQPANKDISLD